MAGAAKRQRQTRYARRPPGQLDIRLVNYRLDLVTILGHQEMISPLNTQTNYTTFELCTLNFAL